MRINTEALRNLEAFSLEAMAEHSPGAVMRLGKAAGQRSAIKVTTTTRDKAYALFRSTANKSANDVVRAAFRKAVEDLFGGFEHIPESVKQVMKLKDYGKGRPLTSRRIIAVQNAIADELIAAKELEDANGELCKAHEVRIGLGLHHLRPGSPEAFNEALRKDLSNRTIADLGKLPEEIEHSLPDGAHKEGLRKISAGIGRELTGMLGEISARIGSQPVTPDTPFQKCAININDIIKPILNQAAGEGRPLIGADLVKAFRGQCEKIAITQRMQEEIDAIAASHNIRGIRAATCLRDNPDILQNLRESVSPEDFKDRIASFESRIFGMSVYKDDIGRATAPLVARLQARVEEGLGLPGGAFDGKMKVDAFMTKIHFATEALYNDFGKGLRLSASDLEKKFTKLTDDFAQTFIDRCREADECASEGFDGGISKKLAEKWKTDIVTCRKPGECTPKKYCEVAAKLGGEELLAALNGKNDTRAALLAIAEFAKKLDRECVGMVGGAYQWNHDLGVEGRTDAVRKIVEAMVDRTPGLGEALRARHEELGKAYPTILPEKSDLVSGNTFCQIVLDEINFENPEN